MSERSKRLLDWPLARKRVGFRLSPADVLLLLSGLASGLLLNPWLGGWAWIAPIVIGHFFLFCNIFRVGTNRELLWTGTFLVNVVAWATADNSNWLVAVLVTQTPITIAVIASALLSPRYHGIGARISHLHTGHFQNTDESGPPSSLGG